MNLRCGRAHISKCVGGASIYTSEHARPLLVPVFPPRHVLHHVTLLRMFDLQ